MDKTLSELIEDWKHYTKGRLVEREEYSILADLAQYARHSTHCRAVLDEKADCDCGFREAYNKWINR